MTGIQLTWKISTTTTGEQAWVLATATTTTTTTTITTITITTITTITVQQL